MNPLIIFGLRAARDARKSRQEAEKQTEELQRQTAELQKQTELLRAAERAKPSTTGMPLGPAPEKDKRYRKCVKCGALRYPEMAFVCQSPACGHTFCIDCKKGLFSVTCRSCGGECVRADRIQSAQPTP